MSQKAGTGNLTPEEILERCEKLGATTRPAGGNKSYMVYPPDKTKDPISISQRWSNGSDRSNAIQRLYRAGLDVLNWPPPEKVATNGHAPSPADMPPAKLVTEGGRPNLEYSGPAIEKSEQDPNEADVTVEITRQDYDTMMEMIQDLATKVESLQVKDPDEDDAFDGMSVRLRMAEEKIAHLDERITHTSKSLGGQKLAANKLKERVDGIADRVAKLTLATPAVKPADPRAELKAKIREFMLSMPEKIWLPRASIAEGLDIQYDGNTDPKIAELSEVLWEMYNANELEKTGQRQTVRWRMPRPAESGDN